MSDNEPIETADLITLAIEWDTERAHLAGVCGGYGSCDFCYHEQTEDDAAEVAREQAEAIEHAASLHCCGGMVCRCGEDGPDQDGGAR